MAFNFCQMYDYKLVTCICKHCNCDAILHFRIRHIHTVNVKVRLENFWPLVPEEIRLTWVCSMNLAAMCAGLSRSG